MILDCHIHARTDFADKTKLKIAMQKAGVDGGIALSLSPSAGKESGDKYTHEERLTNVLDFTKDMDDLYPFFWVDPIAEDALEQVDMAYRKGISGYKIICGSFYPSDEKAMETYQAIANTGRPLLFHSGILWNGTPSAKYNRPGEFECLLDIRHLKFALAHISWPWCDENIAVYGKFLNAYTRRPDLSVEMFIDTTPGTPPLFREDALKKLFCTGYDVLNNVMFGTDSNLSEYNSVWAKEWIDRDMEILSRLGINEEGIQKVFSENLKRFLGLSDLKVDKKYVRPGQ